MMAKQTRIGIGVLAIMVIGLGSARTACATGEAFHEIGFEQALVQAHAEGKYVFVDFYTTWCPPCKMMDQQTFPNAEVVDFLQQKTIAVKIDAEAEVELARKYLIEAYPTLMFINPDGSEKGRLLGFHPPESFVSAAEEIVGGLDPLQKAQRILESAGPNDPVARYEYAQAMIAAEQPGPALEALLWCFEEGAAHNPGFESRRMSVVLEDLQALARTYVPAKTALNQMRRDRTNRLLGETALGEAEARRTVAELAKLNRAMNDTRATAALYDRLEARHPGSPALAMLAGELFDSMREDRQYERLAAMLDIPARAEELFRRHAALRGQYAESAEAAQKLAWDCQRQSLLTEVPKYYEVLAGAGQAEAAERLAGRLLSEEPTAEAHNNLAWAGYLTGQPQPRHVELAAKALELNGGRNVSIVDTYVRILDRRGEKDKAREVLQAAYETAGDGAERGQLDELERSLTHRRAMGRQMQ